MMENKETLRLTDMMRRSIHIIEKRGYVWVGWGIYDYDLVLAHCRERRFLDGDLCIYTYESLDGTIYKSFNTDYFPGGKRKSCLVFRRAKNGQ